MSNNTPDPNLTDQPAPGYAYTPAQAHALRVAFIEQELLPALMKVFESKPGLKSALLCVAQYWDDEAGDAVHDLIVISELDEPDLERAVYYGEPDEVDPNILDPANRFKPQYDDPGSVLGCYDLRVNWNDNHEAIELWAGFAPEGGDQNYDRFQECYAPAVLMRRDGSYQFFDMQRPWLDGIRAEWG